VISGKANVSPAAKIDVSAKVWDFAQIRESAVIESNAIVGASAYVGPGVRVGANSKIQNCALIYEPASLGEGVFIGPAAILTNDRYPRAINSDSSQKSASDWVAVGVEVETGASIGAGAICVAPLKIGCWAMIAAGSVVTKNVPNFALVVGNPARQIGWVGRSGLRLIQADISSMFVCPTTGEKYKLVDGKMELS
jgi:UDP-2-acetamido-3-amino-2,3-dideoxy-glucuronate N-acetyltransferase